ncbi:hypothetical protein PV518_46770 [Streptomyces sp. ND04-05B]|uniref:hypothetical protein n=1 Tax=Streptomyces sp. ND04-05B TaxID=3028693 RepID=UPI0029AC8123|nr:hypothetical protein [Streptomyces sp. ND04-05B]MDX3069546.1 hypothetical protein [Streptomyces sp. ND04-05B]
MNSFLGSLGIVSVAGILSVVLWFGTKDNEGGKLKPLNWGWIVFLSLLAGAAFKAAGPPFSWLADLINDGIRMWGTAVPGYSMPGIALTLIALLLWVKMTRRQVAMTSIAFFYVASGAGAGYSVLADRIRDIAMGLAG